MCALSAMTPGFADQASAHPDVAEVICSDWNHAGFGREAGEPGREAGAPTFGGAEAPPAPTVPPPVTGVPRLPAFAQPAAKRRITAVHHAPTGRRVIVAPLSRPLRRPGCSPRLPSVNGTFHGTVRLRPSITSDRAADARTALSALSSGGGEGRRCDGSARRCSGGSCCPARGGWRGRCRRG